MERERKRERERERKRERERERVGPIGSSCLHAPIGSSERACKTSIEQTEQ